MEHIVYSEKNQVERNEEATSGGSDRVDDEFEILHGDNSEGKIDWSFKQVMAIISLSALWVGK